MTSTNELEKRLLTRCYDSNEEILNILQTRYSTEGEQNQPYYSNMSKTHKEQSKIHSIHTYLKTDDKIPQARNDQLEMN